MYVSVTARSELSSSHNRIQCRPPRDELLTIICLTPSTIRAGVGVHDLIRAPLVELSTRIARKPDAVAPYSITDYHVGKALESAEASGEDLVIVHPFVMTKVGMEVVDWVGVEAIFRYIFHVALNLPRPPLAHPTLLSLPPQLHPVVVDQFHALLFERLLVPQLLVNFRPFFAAAAAGLTDSVILDIGQRGEGSEVSVVHDSQIIESAYLRLDVDEGSCDDWLALKLLEEDPSLPSLLAPMRDLAGTELHDALLAIIKQLKDSDEIAFLSPLLETGKTELEPVPDEEFDVAKVLVEGKVDKIVKKKSAAAGDDEEGEDEGDFVSVQNPLNMDGEQVKIGPVRHRYLEPLFLPEILEGLKPSASEVAAKLGLSEYEDKETIYTGVPEVIGLAVDTLLTNELKTAVWEGVVVISAGKIAANKALGPALLPLLSPFVTDAESASESQPKYHRYVKVPDYFSEFKEKGGETAVYLGGCILAKILISDLQSKLFMSKAEYSSKGPAHYRLLDAL